MAIFNFGKSSKKPAKKAVKKVIKQNIKKSAKPEPKKMIAPLFIDEKKAFEMIKDAKMPVMNTVFVSKEKELEPVIKKMKTPFMMKVASTKIESKMGVGGVIKTETQEIAIQNFNKLMKIKNAESIIIQDYIKGLELFVCAKYDPGIGQLVSIGIGGKYSDMVKDAAFRIAPFGKQDAETMVRELKLFDVLAHYSDGKPINFEKLYDILIKIGNFSIKNAFKKVELDIIATAENCLVIDAKIVK